MDKSLTEITTDDISDAAYRAAETVLDQWLINMDDNCGADKHRGIKAALVAAARAGLWEEGQDTPDFVFEETKRRTHWKALLGIWEDQENVDLQTIRDAYRLRRKDLDEALDQAGVALGVIQSDPIVSRETTDYRPAAYATYNETTDKIVSLQALNDPGLRKSHWYAKALSEGTADKLHAITLYRKVEK